MKKYYDDLKIRIITVETEDILTASSSAWAEEDGDVTKIPNWW